MSGQDKLSLMRDDCMIEAERCHKRRERNDRLQDNKTKREVIDIVCAHLQEFGVDWPWQDIVELIEEIPALDSEFTEEFERG